VGPVARVFAGVGFWHGVWFPSVVQIRNDLVVSAYILR